MWRFIVPSFRGREGSDRRLRVRQRSMAVCSGQQGRCHPDARDGRRGASSDGSVTWQEARLHDARPSARTECPLKRITDGWCGPRGRGRSKGGTASAKIPARPVGSATLAVLEGHLHLGAVGPDLAVLELDVEGRDLRDAEVSQALRSRVDGGRGGLLPRLGACPDELDDLVDAFGHGTLLWVQRMFPAGAFTVHHTWMGPRRVSRRRTPRTCPARKSA